MVTNRTVSVKSYGYIISAACFAIQAAGIGSYVTYGVFFLN